MERYGYGVVTGMAVAAVIACTGTEPQSAKSELAGQVVFSHEVFEDASKFETAAAYKDAHKVTNMVNMSPPATSFKYYASFGSPLGATRYYSHVYDTTTRQEKPVLVQIHDVKSPVMSQVTGSWTFDIPEWPPPTDREIMENVWIEPGHSYRLVLLKPIAAGDFTVSAEAVETQVPEGEEPDEN